MIKRFVISMVAAVFLISANVACSSSTTIVKTTNSTKGLPPGQAKKVTGSQSAKSYAPGQQKKKGKH